MYHIIIIKPTDVYNDDVLIDDTYDNRYTYYFINRYVIIMSNIKYVKFSDNLCNIIFNIINNIRNSIDIKFLNKLNSKIKSDVLDILHE